MTTITYSSYHTNNNRAKFVIFVLVLALVASISISYVQNSHAVDKHGIKAVTVMECYIKGGAIQIWRNIDTNRKAKICMISDGKFGVIIEESNGDPVTAFVKEKLKNINQVSNYLTNCGYEVEQVSDSILEYMFLR